MNCPRCGMEYDDGEKTCPGCMTSLRFARRAGSASDAMAATIARDLFTASSGRMARRLVMVDDDGREIAGWCEAAVRDRVAGHLGPPNAKAEPRPERTHAD